MPVYPYPGGVLTVTVDVQIPEGLEELDRPSFSEKDVSEPYTLVRVDVPDEQEALALLRRLCNANPHFVLKATLRFSDKTL